MPLEDLREPVGSRFQVGDRGYGLATTPGIQRVLELGGRLAPCGRDSYRATRPSVEARLRTKGNRRSVATPKRGTSTKIRPPFHRGYAGKFVVVNPQEGGLMDRDRIEGKLKEAEGKLTDDTLREKQGQAQEKWGEAKEKIEETKEKLEEMRRKREREPEHTRR
jgi:uncharacterized protein YjbJ (UPF0337 family)